MKTELLGEFQSERNCFVSLLRHQSSNVFMDLLYFSLGLHISSCGQCVLLCQQINFMEQSSSVLIIPQHINYLHGTATYAHSTQMNFHCHIYKNLPLVPVFESNESSPHCHLAF